MHLQAAGTRLLAEYDRAAELYRESMGLARRLGDDRGVATEQHNLGHVELDRGNLDEAERLFAARLDFARAAADPYEHAMTMLNGAALAAARGDEEEAQEQFREARRLLDEKGIVLDPDDAGKTHVATALGLAACRLGKRVRFVTVAGLVTELAEGAGRASPLEARGGARSARPLDLRRARLRAPRSRPEPAALHPAGPPLHPGRRDHHEQPRVR